MIIDQLIAIPSPQSDDELPIERGQLTYKIKWSDLAGNDIVDLQSDMTTAQGDITDLQSDMTTALGDITDLQSDMTTAQAALSNVVLEAAEQTILATDSNITSSWITQTGLTADHVVGNWGLRNSDGAIPVNAPPCDITIETGSGQWRYTLGTNSSAFFIKPTFVLKQN